MSSEIAIHVDQVSKCYQIYGHPRDRLKQFVFPRVQQILRQQTKQYFREFWALRDISLSLTKGDSFGIIGRNGAGKSTLLQIISGILHPTSGSISVTGRVAGLLELGAGFNPEFTGRENVFLNASLFGLSRQDVEERFDDIAAFADIGEFLYQPIKTYSSGMVVRLAFAVVAHVDADILIIDEALAVGDTAFTQKCTKYIKKFRENGTLLFVSHNTQSVLDLCDQAIWINAGKAESAGSAIDVVRDYSAYLHQAITKDASVSVRHAKGQRPRSSSDATPSIQKFPYRLELFSFDFNAPFWGVGGATITDVKILDPKGEEVALITECGEISIRVECRANLPLNQPVVGFTVRNNRGVELITENSFEFLRTRPLAPIEEGQEFSMTFTLFLPFLAPGEYTIGAAIADGIPGNHIQHHRRDEALRFSVTSSHVVYGIFSMPLTSCVFDSSTQPLKQSL